MDMVSDTFLELRDSVAEVLILVLNGHGLRWEWSGTISIKEVS